MQDNFCLLVEKLNSCFHSSSTVMNQMAEICGLKFNYLIIWLFLLSFFHCKQSSFPKEYLVFPCWQFDPCVNMFDVRSSNGDKLKKKFNVWQWFQIDWSAVNCRCIDYVSCINDCRNTYVQLLREMNCIAMISISQQSYSFQ